MQKFHVKLTFTEPLLGTAPMNKDVYGEWIASRAEDTDKAAEELETIEEMTEKGTTGFHRLPDGTPCLYDYAIKGYCKESCGLLWRDKDSESSKTKAYKKLVDGLVFPAPRQIAIITDKPVGILERPLRAATAQGERVALARSEVIEAGATMDFDLLILGGVSDQLLDEWLTYGALHGLGQWRNAGYGRFDYVLTRK